MRGTPLPFYHSLNKTTLSMGVNKELFDLVVTLCFTLAFSGHFINLFTDFLAVVVFLASLYFGRKLSAVDPQIMEVYRRHIHLKKYYPPISGIHATIAILKPSVPFYEGKS